MAIVTLTLDDTSGELEMGIRIPAPGFDPESKACQMANIIVNYLDTIADRQGDKVETIEVTPEEKSALAGLVVVPA